jgi:hypothetical protein
MRMRFALVVALSILLTDSAIAASPAQRCERGVAAAVGSCVARVNARVRRCYAQTGSACAASDSGIATAVARLEATIGTACPDAASAQAAGFGAVVTPSAVVDRAREACLGEAATLAARTFGGPQAALLVGATAEAKSCLDDAFAASAAFLKSSYRTQRSCIRKAHGGGTCDVGATTAQVAFLESKAAGKVEAACPDLAGLLKITPTEYLRRAARQAACLVASAHGDGGPLSLGCGPRPEVVVPARGQWVKVTLDEATWGTRCGDGSDYAFWLRLAPAGQPAWRVVTDMQGGGVCVFENNCASVSPGLFRADEGQPGGGYLSTNPAVNPFSDATMLFMPYCTQDLHIGGGGTSTWPSITVHRFGAVNARAALRYLRDVLWAELEATDPDGWHPDRLRVMFAGESAGAFGVMYNYHDALDELRWVNTTAVPDSGLALDSGAVGALPALIGGAANPGWDIFPMLPPYCTAGNCMVGPVIEAASVPRLKATPWQQILNVSNQVDSTQRSTTGFASLPAWTNALRTTYCDERGQTGLKWFLSASSNSIHTMLRSDALYTGLTAQGVAVRDYVSDAMDDPDATLDRVDEGTLVVDRPGTNPFPCALPPP